jgi:hypothetical protein
LSTRVCRPAGPFGVRRSTGCSSRAKQDEDAEDEIAGQGRGFVDVYDTGTSWIAWRNTAS